MALFDPTNSLISALEKEGNSLGAEKLRTGMGAVNGLTDGSAVFLEAIEDVQRLYLAELNSRQQASLKEIHEAV